MSCCTKFWLFIPKSNFERLWCEPLHAVSAVFFGRLVSLFFSLHSMCSSLFFYQPSMSFFHFFISISLARCDHSVILFGRDHHQQQRQYQYAALIDFQHLCAGNCIEMFTRKEEKKKKKKNKTHNTNTNTHSHAYP